MASSLLIEHDAWFMNESLAFYMSTNTFKNPVFNLEADGLIGGEQHQAATDGSDPNGQSEFNFIRNLKSNFRLNGPKQKLEIICDNFLFAVKGKVFVIKLNVKHRLSRFRKFLSKRLTTSNANKPHTAKTTSNKTEHGDKLKQDDERRSSLDLGGDYLFSLRNDHVDSFWNKIKPPKSARSLELQQACLLNRLEKAKRDSQKLFSRENHLLGHLGQPGESFPREQKYHLHSRQSPKQYHVQFMANASQQSQVLPSDLLKLSAISKKSQLARKRNGNKVSAAAGPSCSIVTKQKRTCIVCYTNRPNIVTIPCEHNDICSDCFIEIIFMAVKNSQYPLKCVLCRQKVEKVRCSRQIYADQADG